MRVKVLLVLIFILHSSKATIFHEMLETLADSTDHAYKYISHLFKEDSEGNKKLKGGVSNIHDLMVTLQQAREYLLTHRENANEEHFNKTTRLQKEIGEHSNSLKNEARERVISTIQLAQSSLAILKEERQYLQESRDKELREYVENDNNLKFEIAECTEILENLEEIKKSVTSGGFLQMNSKSKNLIVGIIKNKINKAWERSEKRDKFSLHMIKYQTNIAADINFSDIESLEKIIHMVQTLIQRFRAEKAQEDKSEEEECGFFKETISRIDREIYRNQKEYEISLKDKEQLEENPDAAISLYLNNQLDLNNYHEKKRENLINLHNADIEHYKLLDQIEKEIKLLSKSQSILMNNGHTEGENNMEF